MSASLKGTSVGGLLLVGVSLISAAAEAQRVAPTTSSVTVSPGTHPATDALEEQAAARVAAAVCSKRIVLLGELPDTLTDAEAVHRAE